MTTDFIAVFPQLTTASRGAATITLDACADRVVKTLDLETAIEVTQPSTSMSGSAGSFLPS